MKMIEFGIQNDKKMLFIHGAGTTYKMWHFQIETLQKDYHIYAPILSGHAIGEKSVFISPSQEAKHILTWFYERKIEHIFLIAGTSLGADVVVEILMQNPSFSDFAFVESIKSYHYGKVMTSLFCYLGKKILRKAANVDGLIVGSHGNKIVSDDMKVVLTNMDNISLDNILMTASRFSIPNTKVLINAKTYVLYGAKEKKVCKKNSEEFMKSIEDVKCIVLDGYDHGELALGNHRKYIELLNQLITKK